MSERRVVLGTGWVGIARQGQRAAMVYLCDDNGETIPLAPDSVLLNDYRYRLVLERVGKKGGIG